MFLAMYPLETEGLQKDPFLSSLKLVAFYFILTALKSKGFMFSSGQQKMTVN